MGASVPHATGPVINGAQIRPGAAITYWRKMRNLTQVQCAVLMGQDGKRAYTVHAWRKWESGERTPDVALWFKIARILRVNVSDLLGTEAAGFDVAEPVAAGAVLVIRDALIGLPSPVDYSEDEYTALASSVALAWRQWQAGGDGRFTVVGEALPALITRAESALRACDQPRVRRSLYATTSCLYQLTWAYLRARGAFQWAMVAVDKARGAGEASGLAEYDAAAVWGYAAMLSTTHNSDAAYGLLDQAIRRIEPTLADADAGVWEVFGQMHLLQAIQAVRLQRGEEATALIDTAERVAARTGESNRHWTAFGGSNVAIHRTSVELERSRYKRAVALGEQVDISKAPAAERKVAFLVQLAHCYLRAGRAREAVHSLGEAAALSAAETASLVLARETAWEIAAKPAPAYARQLGDVMASLGLAS